MKKLTKERRAALCRRLRRGERPVEVAREFGLSKSRVSRIMRDAGIPTRSAKAAIIAAHRQFPDRDTAQIAAAVGCSASHVRSIALECRLDIPAAPSGRRLAALGRAALAAGLTVEAIHALAASMSGAPR